MKAALPICAFTLCLMGCTASLEGSAGGDSGLGPNNESVSIDDLLTDDPESLPDGVPTASRVVRLSYEAYDRTVSELLGIAVSASEFFPAEPPTLGPYEQQADLRMNQLLLGEVMRAAAELSEQSVDDPTSYSSLVPCGDDSDACRDEFIADFGKRAYRRPLTDAEKERMKKLFALARDEATQDDPFKNGVKWVIEATLSSPKFLYRIEQGSGETDGAGEKLSAFEMVSRLAFWLWGTGPDRALLAQAESGALNTEQGLLALASQMVQDPRAEARVLEFHRRWLDLEALASADKDPQAFPAYTPELRESMQAEFDAFVRFATLEQSGAIHSLLTSEVGFADGDLASVYGISSVSPTMSQVNLPAEQGRKGILTRAAFLAGHSSATTRTSPILRGVFVLRRVACQEIPNPPPGAELLKPDSMPTQEILTTRGFFEWQTSLPTCAGCHERINPAGFAFESFDAIGAYRSSENGAPIDSSGELTIGTSALSFTRGAEFLDQLADVGETRACYARNWYRYLSGREEVSGDLRTLGRLTKSMSDPAFGVRDLLLQVAQSTPFTHLPPI